MALIGLETFFCSVQNQLKRPEDALVCSLHWCLITNGFKCIGKGENEASNARKSEKLPDGWNKPGDLYTLLYKDSKNNQTYLLKVIRVEQTLLVHLMRLNDETMGDLTVQTTDYVTGDISHYDSAYHNLEALVQKFKMEVIDQVKKSPKSSRKTDTAANQRRRSREETRRERRPDEDDPLRIGPPRHPSRQAPPEWGDPGDPFQIGRGDLDPLAGGGGGMMFDPMRGGFPRGGMDPNAGLPGRLPRGAVPPGARFDPFGPPDLDRSGNPRPGAGRTGPDPDHLPPPGYDDMFM